MSPVNLYPKKYGQVLLKNKNVALQEVLLLGDISGRSVLEIGPGPGTLTEILLQKGAVVTAIESDHRFYEILKMKFESQIKGGTLKIEKNDFLELGGGNPDFIIGNIPYHISSPILFHLEKFNFTRSVLMVQLEFARRMVGKPGTEDYSRLSISTALRYRVKLEKNSKKGEFLSSSSCRFRHCFNRTKSGKMGILRRTYRKNSYGNFLPEKKKTEKYNKKPARRSHG